jgi:hypothetical protein
MQSKSDLKWFAAACVALLLETAANPTAQAGYMFTGGFSETVYGVASYGLPVAPGIPQYIPNGFTGLNSVLVSPGNGFLTADTSNPNNIFDTGIVGVPHYSALIGGSNGNGAFGFGQTLLLPTYMGFSLQDVNPDGAGAAAFSVASMISTFTEDGTGFPLAMGGMISVGAWLAVSGVFNSPLSAGAVALTVFVESSNLASPFFGGRSYELVLAAGAIGNYRSVAYSDINDVVQSTAVIFNDGVHPFSGLAVASELLPIAGMMHDTITMKTTLTVIADPMDFDSIFPTTDLLHDAGPLPNFSLMGTPAVPEPTSFALIGMGVFGFVGGAIRRRRQPVA